MCTDVFTIVVLQFLPSHSQFVDILHLSENCTIPYELTVINGSGFGDGVILSQKSCACDDCAIVISCDNLLIKIPHDLQKYSL